MTAIILVHASAPSFFLRGQVIQGHLLFFSVNNLQAQNGFMRQRRSQLTGTWRTVRLSSKTVPYFANSVLGIRWLWNINTMPNVCHSCIIVPERLMFWSDRRNWTIETAVKSSFCSTCALYGRDQAAWGDGASVQVSRTGWTIPVKNWTARRQVQHKVTFHTSQAEIPCPLPWHATTQQG